MESISKNLPNWNAVESVIVWEDAQNNAWFYVGQAEDPDSPDGFAKPICVKVANSSLKSQYSGSGIHYKGKTGRNKTVRFANPSETSWDPKVIQGVMAEIEKLKSKGLHRDFVKDSAKWIAEERQRESINPDDSNDVKPPVSDEPSHPDKKPKSKDPSGRCDIL